MIFFRGLIKYLAHNHPHILTTILYEYVKSVWQSANQKFGGKSAGDKTVAAPDSVD